MRAGIERDAVKLTPSRRDYLTDLLLATELQVKTINRRGDVLLAKVRPIADAASNRNYELRQFRIASDQHNGDRILAVKQVGT